MLENWLELTPYFFGRKMQGVRYVSRLGANLAVGYHSTFSPVYVHECLYFSSFFQVPYRAVFTYVFRCSCVYAHSD